ncbi:YjjG family noncanonical pyrimidine nucleotidase [Natronoflexus pectinivorans]|uniref:Putative hydrolase of the HAD superfamily n=1 Tax=Natronoflexus pectinivorans TaxID=682526 RepID=A0A4R2GH16_9BACT|nr:YjjG family noncanonical pyrimidine nucleotidase [Natronoflexus pectinivorans]TCO07668.1 putative hydrolase of the HAD superfamily [Natronoflexus pectinivorans]
MYIQQYQHLFFDLDHTLWDFNTNEKHTLSELFIRYKLDKHFDSFDIFFNTYEPINADLWLKYRHGEIRKPEVAIGRFHKTFLTSGLDDFERARKFSFDFVAENSKKTALIPGAIELLEYLHPKYNLHIITNGFVEAQHVKMEKSGLKPFFQKIFISEEIGAQKPKQEFFEHAIRSCNAKKKESLIIGDSLETDIAGAKNFGLDHVYFNPAATPHNEVVFMEIRSLKELLDCL